ncbi:MAG: hypothetical protein WCH46_04010 [bacterium]
MKKQKYLGFSVDRWEFQLSNLVVLIFLAEMCFRTFYHLWHSSTAYLDFVTDDFFYYFLPAKNLVLHGISSFDGITITNGFHPLWMGCITTAFWICGKSDTAFFGLLAIVSALSSYLTFRLLWRLGVEIFTKQSFAAPAALIATLILSRICFLGMEVTITIPLYLYIILRISRMDFDSLLSRGELMFLGFLSSILILSRLDAALFVALILVLFIFLSNQKFIDKIRRLLYFMVGGIALPIYVTFAYLAFGNILSVSSLAKTSNTAIYLNPDSLRSILFDRDGLGAIIFSIIALILYLFKRQTFQASKHRIILLPLLFPLVYYPILLVGSNWFLNRWYLYPLPIAFFFSASFLSESSLSFLSENIFKKIRQSLLVLVSPAAMYFSFTLLVNDTTNWKPEPMSIYLNAQKMQPFIQSHPGIYAMGDQAGLTAYMLNVPVIQLEGLNADFNMLHHIQHEDDLVKVLHEYHVDYLIETSDVNGLPKQGVAFNIEEPHTGQAGKFSKKMRGLIQSEPIYTQVISNASGFKLQTYIFDIRTK